MFTQHSEVYHFDDNEEDDIDVDNGSDRGHSHRFPHHHHHFHPPHQVQNDNHVHYFTFGDTSEAPPSRDPPNHTDVFLFHRSNSSRLRFVDLHDVVAYVLQSIGLNDAVAGRGATSAAAVAAAAQLPLDRSHAIATALDSAWFESRRASASIMPEDDGADGRQPSIPRDVPPGSDQQARGTAAVEALLPPLAGMLRALANRIDGTEVPALFDGTGQQQGQELFNQFGSLAATLASTGALVSTLLPSEGTQQTGDQAAEPQAEMRPSGPDTNTNRNAQGIDRSNSELRSTRINGTSAENREGPQTPRHSSGGNNASRPPRNAQTRSSRATDSEPPRPRLGRSNPSTASSVSEGLAANGDFVLRMLSYYLRSISPAPTNGMGPLATEGATADSVLDNVYGSGARPRPEDWWLRVIQIVMRNLTPQQFHRVLSGDFRPLNSLEVDIWDVICENVVGCNPTRERGDIPFRSIFTDTVCEALHTLTHEIEEYHGISAGLSGGERLANLCSHVMPVVEDKMDDLSMLLTCQRENSEFGQDLLNLLKSTWGELSNILARDLQVDWQALLAILRAALHAVGKQVVGESLAVLFPTFANLFSSRAESVYNAFRENPEISDPIYQRARRSEAVLTRSAGSDRGGAVMRQRAFTDTTAHDAEDLTDGDLSDLLDVSAAEFSEDMSDGDGSSCCRSDADREGQANALHANRPRMAANDSDVELTTEDFDDLAAQLDAEYAGASDEVPRANTIPAPSAEDMDIIARELEKEHANSNPSASSTSEKPTRIPTTGVKRMAGMSSLLAASMSRPGFAPGLGVGGGAGAAAMNRTTFSTARSVPRTSRGQPSMIPRDDFETVLGPQDGKTWRRVVHGDEAKVRSSVKGPLSRGYQNKKSSVPSLTLETAAVMAVEDAKAAAREAQLSGEATEQLVNVVRENRSMYLQELENAISSRLATDPDFDRETFPNAAARFSKPG
ncbi:unnamed protein product [Chondrus crispus]|uniref:Uncharacterized protein n=1 Tax=Chondrus crispus TaxID=2769 RepID=R7Q8Q1_CHOCR|nr:unnamed protein product [Chondrus crispus]CDF34902.1 unnamed protein product [Chondrus crispus]|eukprot:XP_005714721.1 unnamed protein product [Chondrus crispus]